MMQRTDVKSQLLAHWKIVVCATAFLCYIQTFAFPFVYDDKALIANNSYLTSFRYLPRFFTMHVWDSYSVQILNFYRPLLLTWRLFNHALFGFDPVGWHFMNVLLHICATYLLCLVVEKFCGDRGIAIITGLLFAIHPVHVEVVAWVSAASDMLMAVFILASLLCYLKSREEPHKKRWLMMTWLTYAAALLSKEPAVMMPLMVFALVWLLQDSQAGFRRKASASLKATVPFAAMVLVYFAIRWLLFGREHYDSFKALDTGTMLKTIPIVICFYLKLLIFPFHLSPLYDVPQVESVTQSIFILPLLVAVSIGVLLFWWWRKDRSRTIPFACLWGLWLVPALHLSSFGPDKRVEDRYLYLASAGFCVLVAAAIRSIRIPSRETAGVPIAQVTAAALAGAMLIFGVLLQETYWSSDVLLFYRALKIAPKNDTAKENLADVLVKEEHFSQAVPLFMDVIQRQPQRWILLRNLGISYYRLGDYANAIDYLTRAIAVDPTDYGEHSYMGLALLKLQRWELAADSFQYSLQIKQEQMESHFGLGIIFEHRGQWQEAMREYAAAVKIQPRNSVLQEYVKAFQARLNSPSAMKPSSKGDPEI